MGKGDGYGISIDGPALAANTWTHIKVTMAGTTGSLIVTPEGSSDTTVTATFTGSRQQAPDTNDIQIGKYIQTSSSIQKWPSGGMMRNLHLVSAGVTVYPLSRSSAATDSVTVMPTATGDWNAGPLYAYIIAMGQTSSPTAWTKIGNVVAIRPFMGSVCGTVDDASATTSCDVDHDVVTVR